MNNSDQNSPNKTGSTLDNTPKKLDETMQDQTKSAAEPAKKKDNTSTISTLERAGGDQMFEKFLEDSEMDIDKD